ncbi:MAG: AAA family ATPase [Nanoarchaeota archaeon]|nr:AAA family ATPase [Nanoarchaeota archaeon]
MIIKKVILENIRSYEYEEVELGEGSTLLSGDVGSGKTSILLAIEFGLFGLQPGQKGSILLKNGKDKGKVTLEFQVDEKNILVERTLKKGKSISQDYSSITIDGKKEEISVTELKQRILDLLNYPPEFSKKQNLLYKFTVYTPQEEMKEIILEDPEVRINTLRHVFGIDKYKTIIENASVLRLKLREEKRLMEGITSNMDEDEKEISKKEEELEVMKKSTKNLEEDFFERIKIRKEKEKDKEEIEKKQEEKNKIKEEIGKSKIMILSKKENFSTNEKLASDLKREIENFKNLNFDEKKIRELEELIIEKKKEKEKLFDKNFKINSEIEILKTRSEEHQKLHRTLSDLKLCPTCQQDVDAVHRANVLNNSYNEISKSKNRIEELEIEKKEVLIHIKENELKISSNEKSLTDLKILKMKLEGITEKEKRLNEIEKNKELLKKDVTLLEKHLVSLNDSFFSLSKYDSIYNEKERELKEALKKEKISEIKLAELKKEIEVYSKTIMELKEKQKKIIKIKKKLEYVSELENWINKKFVPVVTFLEKNVMASLKKEFSALFSEWFQTLVPDHFSVRLSDDFTPLIEQQDYEIDYAYLSGGERTAIALAYRLALNQVINSIMSRIKTKELLILDEPTDGFSEQQLDKMRGVLEQLNVRQLIIVSHEQKIEGFVEKIIRFKKSYGLSKKE